MLYAAKIILSLAGLSISAGAFYLNLNTPIQVGPIPVFGGGALFIITVIFL